MSRRQASRPPPLRQYLLANAILGVIAYVAIRAIYDAELERAGRIPLRDDPLEWLMETVTIHLPGLLVWLAALGTAAWSLHRIQNNVAGRLALDAGRQAALARVALTADLTDDAQRDILDRSVEAATGLPADGASIVLWDARRGEFLLSASTVTAQARGGPAHRARPDDGATRWIVDHREPIVVADVARDPFGPNAMLTDDGFRAYAGVPVLFGDEAIGVLYALHRRPTAIDEQGLAFLREIARRTAVAISRDRLLADLRAANRQLEELGGRLGSILRSTSEGVCGLDHAGRFTFVNPAAARLLGFSEQELIGRHAHSTVHGRRRDGSPYPAADCPMRTTFETGEHVVRDDEVLWHKDGRPIEVEWSATAIFDAGAVAGAVLSFRDIAERKAVERMKDEFVSVASHELRTPLTSIRGALGLIAGGVFGTLPAEADELVRTALRNAERLGRLVNDLLDLDRMRSGATELQRQEVDIAGIARQAVEVMRPMADAAGVGLELEMTSCVLPLDADRMLQTLTNLVSNAIKFSPAGGTITIRSERSESEVRVSVIDQGRGIPAEQLGLIFERFHQVRAADSSRSGGTGLGLAISREIVAQHGGRIWAESEGRGSTFTIALPCPAATNGGAA
ncbi:MAG TPA: ATP-binding protein [Candidatus Limnocylindria bacterium]|nr:ATP-binding protein [Candidatus Limnocylindria bacterium]